MELNNGAMICPKCGMEMEEDEEDFSNMTDGQRSNHDMGFAHPFSCSECGYYGIYEGQLPINDDLWEDEDINELVEITRINPSSFEDVIENALKNKCFVEATSLIHNVIEVYLKRKLEDFFMGDKERYDILKGKIKFKYLKDYNSFCYILGLIDKNTHLDIIKFNTERNRTIHDLLKKETTVEELRQIARRGRRIQMILSPLNHTHDEIKGIMKVFESITTH